MQDLLWLDSSPLPILGTHSWNPPFLVSHQDLLRDEEQVYCGAEGKWSLSPFCLDLAFLAVEHLPPCGAELRSREGAGGGQKHVHMSAEFSWKCSSAVGFLHESFLEQPVILWQPPLASSPPMGMGWEWLPTSSGQRPGFESSKAVNLQLLVMAPWLAQGLRKKLLWSVHWQL